jgi:hypothetical protein
MGMITWVERKAECWKPNQKEKGGKNQVTSLFPLLRVYVWVHWWEKAADLVLGHPNKSTEREATECWHPTNRGCNPQSAQVQMKEVGMRREHFPKMARQSQRKMKTEGLVSCFTPSLFICILSMELWREHESQKPNVGKAYRYSSDSTLYTMNFPRNLLSNFPLSFCKHDRF